MAPVLTAAWLLGVSEQFWSQATVTEVYTLNALLFLHRLRAPAARDAASRTPMAPRVGRRHLAGLANHGPLMVLATPGLALVRLPAWRDMLPRLPRLIGVAFASAALP